MTTTLLNKYESSTAYLPAEVLKSVKMNNDSANPLLLINCKPQPETENKFGIGRVSPKHCKRGAPCGCKSKFEGKMPVTDPKLLSQAHLTGEVSCTDYKPHFLKANLCVNCNKLITKHNAASIPNDQVLLKVMYHVRDLIN